MRELIILCCKDVQLLQPKYANHNQIKISQSSGINLWLVVGGATHQSILYLNSGCSGLMGRPPTNCPALYFPSPSLHAAQWMDGWMEDEWMVRWMDGKRNNQQKERSKLENNTTLFHTNDTWMLK